MTKKLDIILSKAKLEIEDDKKFQKTPSAEIANYFKQKLKSTGYIARVGNWELTKKWSLKVLSDDMYSHITVADWKECIDWVFSTARYKIEFWGMMNINSFRTVTKIYDVFNDWRIRENISNGNTGTKRRIKYGKK